MCPEVGTLCGQKPITQKTNKWSPYIPFRKLGKRPQEQKNRLILIYVETNPFTGIHKKQRNKTSSVADNKPSASITTATGVRTYNTIKYYASFTYSS